MTGRTAHRGGAAVRWAYGVFLTLCVVLAVLVHHETATMGSSSSMPSAARAGHVMPGSAHAVPVMPNGAAPSISDIPPRDAAGACSGPGMQHCTTASVDSVQLAVPGQSVSGSLASLQRAADGRMPATAVGRAPPDLSVLSQLRL
ncbi:MULTISPECIES: hypothetical protein [unclassified Streptomyces]|uniref:hypothetical protein n=1 Tax=unclassified Streptomyces TaxID=2593676 RepID=UPI0034041C27